MPRRSHQLGAADYALLGLLMLGPRHGYELAPYFATDGTLGLVCTLGVSRLYALLHALEELGLVHAEKLGGQRRAAAQGVLADRGRRGGVPAVARSSDPPAPADPAGLPAQAVLLAAAARQRPVDADRATGRGQPGRRRRAGGPRGGEEPGSFARWCTSRGWRWPGRRSPGWRPSGAGASPRQQNPNPPLRLPLGQRWGEGSSPSHILGPPTRSPARSKGGDRCTALPVARRAPHRLHVL